MWIDEASIDTSATPERIWSLLSSVGTWSQWNGGVASIDINGPFAAGTTFTMRTPSQDAFVSTLKAVTPLQEFTDETLVDETRVIVRHQIIALEAGVTRITYTTIVIGKTEEQIGLAVTEDFPAVLAGLKAAAEG